MLFKPRQLWVLLVLFVIVLLPLFSVLAESAPAKGAIAPQQGGGGGGWEVVCPSGVGQVVCEFVFSNPVAISVLAALCENGRLPDSICEVVEPGLELIRVPAACPVLVEYAQGFTSQVCSELERDQFCYGSDILEVIPDALSDGPGSFMPLPSLATVNAGSYVLREASFGIGIANSHANIPRAFLPASQGLRFLMFGGVRVEDAFTEEEAVFLPDEPLEVTVGAQGAALYDQPAGFGAQTTIGNVEAGTILLADLLSDDERWVRVMVEHDLLLSVGLAAWVSSDDVTFADDADLTTLDRMGADEGTSYESLYFQPGQGQGGNECSLLTDLLVAQAPYDIVTTFQVNGATISTTGTLVLLFEFEADDLADDDASDAVYLRVYLADGVAQVFSAGEMMILPPGFTARIELDPVMQNLGADGMRNDYTILEDARWEDRRPSTRREWQRLAELETLPPGLLNQLVDAPLCDADDENALCDLTYELETDEALVAELCANGLLPAELAICTL